MKKILLLDDNLYDYRKAHGFNNVDAGLYNDILVCINKLSADNDLSTILDKASCILMHSSLSDYYNGSFHKDSHEVRDYVLEDFSDYGKNISIVLFSDGDSEEAVFDEQHNIIRKLRKSTFYERLDDFLIDYRNHGIVNLRILAYGNDYNRIEIRRCVLSIISRLSHLSGVLDNDIIDIISGNELDSIVRLSNPMLGLTYDELLITLEDNPITIEKLKLAFQRIINSFNQYGRNIYPWNRLIS